MIKEPFEDSQSNKSDWDRPRTCVGVRVYTHMPIKGRVCTRIRLCIKSMLVFSIHHKVNLEVISSD